MSADFGGRGLSKEVYMKLSSFGELSINVVPRADNEEIMSVYLLARNRKDPVVMETNKDETVDQFCTRIRSMMRALWNSEPRETVEQKELMKQEEKKAQTWEEQKAEVKQQAANKGAGASGNVAGAAGVNKVPLPVPNPTTVAAIQGTGTKG